MNALGLIVSLSLAASPPSWMIATSDEIVTANGPLIAQNDFTIACDQKSFSTKQWYLFTRSDLSLPAWPREAHAILANGDRVAGKISAADAQSIELTNPILGPVKIPVTAMAFLAFTPLPAGTPADPMQAEWIGDRKTDRIRYANGDIASGAFEKITTDLSTIEFRKTGEKSSSINRNRVTGLSFSQGLSRVRTPKGVYAHAVLSDGSRLTIAKWSITGNDCDCEAAAGFKFKLAMAEVVRLQLFHGIAELLTELTPKTNTTTSKLKTTWPMQINRSAKRHPLMLEASRGKDTFQDCHDFGLGTHPETTLVYAIDKKYSRFRSLVGFDTVSNRATSAKVTISIDGQDHAVECQSDRGGMAMDLDVKNVKQLSLKIESPTIGADVNWVDCVLIKAK